LLFFVVAAPVLRGEEGKPRALERKSAGWLQEVRLLLLPEEERLFREIDAADREEFRRLFWARRIADPHRASAEGPEDFRKARTRAEKRFGGSGVPGAQTGCAQVLFLLGEPDEATGRELKLRFDSVAPMRDGALAPETWVYKSRADRRFRLPGGELRLEFDDGCRFVEGAPMMEELKLVARARVVHPEIDFARTVEGRLVRLDDVLAGPALDSSTRPLPASAFPVEVETKLLLRGPTGAGFAAGLVRGRPGLAGSGAHALVVAAEARGEGGEVAARYERKVTVRPEADGLVVAGWGLSLPRGRHDVLVAIRSADGDRAGVASTTIEVPRFDGPDLVVTPLFLAREVADPQPDAAADSYAPFALGTTRRVPHFGNVFAPADAVEVVAVVYGGATDPATGKAALRTRLRFLKDGTPVAADEQSFATSAAVVSVGPVPLRDFAPGSYVIRLDVTDDAARSTQSREATLVIRPGGPAPGAP
jgi:GWxTD domain-containing protein